MEHPFNSNTLAGTVGGTLFVLCLKVSAQEVLHTSFLAAIGAGVSFSISIVLKYLIRKWKR